MVGQDMAAVVGHEERLGGGNGCGEGTGVGILESNKFGSVGKGTCLCLYSLSLPQLPVSVAATVLKVLRDEWVEITLAALLFDLCRKTVVAGPTIGVMLDSNWSPPRS
jgi:hypothetical protein